MNGAIAIANDSRFAVQTTRIEGFLVLPDANINPLTTDTSIYFQKLWIYPGTSATSGIINANVGTVYVGNTGNQIVSKTVTLAINAVANTRNDLTVTATCANHGFSTGDKVRLSGASDGAYNNEFRIAVVDANTFTFALLDQPGTRNPTGTITAAGLQAVASANQVLPDALLNSDLPLKYELPLGAKQPLSSILVKGAAGDGVFYRVW